MGSRTNWAKMAVSSGGTGSITLTAVSGCPTFAQKHGSGSTSIDYVIADETNGRYESGTGSYNGTTHVLSGRTVVESYTGGAYGTSAINATTSAVVYCGLPVQAITDFATTILDDANASAVLSTLGITTDGAAVASDVNTGTSTTLAVTPDALAGSNAFTKSVVIEVFGPTTDVTSGDGKAYVLVPAALNGMDVISVKARVITAGTTNATTIDLYNVTDSVDILSSAASIASASTAVASGTVNTSNDSLATDDLLRVDVTTVSTTAPKGLYVVIEARLP